MLKQRQRITDNKALELFIDALIQYPGAIYIAYREHLECDYIFNEAQLRRTFWKMLNNRQITMNLDRTLVYNRSLIV